MKHKMISLCDETFERAKQFGNFSKWVRREILDIIQDEQREVWYRCLECTTMEKAPERVLVHDTYFRGADVYCALCSEERGYRIWMVKA